MIYEQFKGNLFLYYSIVGFGNPSYFIYCDAMNYDLCLKELLLSFTMMNGNDQLRNKGHRLLFGCIESQCFKLVREYNIVGKIMEIDE